MHKPHLMAAIVFLIAFALPASAATITIEFTNAAGEYGEAWWAPGDGMVAVPVYLFAVQPRGAPGAYTTDHAEFTLNGPSFLTLTGGEMADKAEPYPLYSPPSVPAALPVPLFLQVWNPSADPELPQLIPLVTPPCLLAYLYLSVDPQAPTGDYTISPTDTGYGSLPGRSFTLHIVPEPTSIVLSALGALLLTQPHGWRRRSVPIVNQ